MKIFITGSEGFLARELVLQCKQKGIEVVGCDIMEKPSSEYEYYKDDFRSKDIVKIIPQAVDAIVHLAALSRDPDCKGKAYECFDMNVMGSLNLMNAAAERNAKQFMFASSEWVYESFLPGEEKDEDSFIDIAKHTSEYALSKLVTEANLRQRFLQGFCPTTIFRFAIIYGPRKSNWSAVETVASKVKNQSEVSVPSFKTGRRFVHVSDIAAGILKALGLQGFHIINLSANRLLTLGEIMEITERLLGKAVKKVETDPQAISVRNPSNARAKKLLEWEPQISFEVGIKSILPFI